MSGQRGEAQSYERSPLDIEELVSDTLYLAHVHRSLLAEQNDKVVRGWLLRTMRYLCRNHVRRVLARRRMVGRMEREPLPLVASPEDELTAREDHAEHAAVTQRMLAALVELRPDFQDVLILDSQGESGPEMARQLGITAGATRSRLMRARNELRTRYRQTETPQLSEPHDSLEGHADG